MFSQFQFTTSIRFIYLLIIFLVLLHLYAVPEQNASKWIIWNESTLFWIITNNSSIDERLHYIPFKIVHFTAWLRQCKVNLIFHESVLSYSMHYLKFNFNFNGWCKWMCWPRTHQIWILSILNALNMCSKSSTCRFVYNLYTIICTVKVITNAIKPRNKLLPKSSIQHISQIIAINHYLFQPLDSPIRPNIWYK